MSGDDRCPVCGRATAGPDPCLGCRVIAPERVSESALELAVRHAFGYALTDYPGGVYTAVHDLPRRDLERLAKAAALVKQAAQDELDARPAGPRLLVPVVNGHPAEVIHVIAPTLRRLASWCQGHGVNPHSRNVHRVAGPEHLRGISTGWYVFLGVPAGLNYLWHQDFLARLAMLQENPEFRNAEEG